MNWRVIGQSVVGVSHQAAGKGCEDSSKYEVIELPNNEEALICCASDGAGSAINAAFASESAVIKSFKLAKELALDSPDFEDKDLLKLVERVYDHLADFAQQSGDPINEYSCTLLGVILMPNRAGFFQIGDGAIVRDDGNGFFKTLWWPHNGEYQNTTAFLIDDPNLQNLKFKVLEESIQEVAIFTDGLQTLILDFGMESVHQPFFIGLFPWFRKAQTTEQLTLLKNKLHDYLSGPVINSKTDDDKTLIIATRT